MPVEGRDDGPALPGEPRGSANEMVREAPNAGAGASPHLNTRRLPFQTAGLSKRRHSAPSSPELMVDPAEHCAEHCIVRDGKER